jgi:hypothetical protein
VIFLVFMLVHLGELFISYVPSNHRMHISQFYTPGTHLEGGRRRGRDRMVVGFTTTYAISAYHHGYCEFESRSGRGVQYYDAIKFVSD